MPVGTDFRGHGDISDTTAILGNQGNQRFGEGEGADKIHVERLADDVNLRMLAVDAHIARNTGIVNEQRQIGVFLANLHGSLLDAVEVFQLNIHPTEHVDALCLQFADGFRGALFVTCADYYLPATEAEMFCYSKANTLISTCH